jgi:hypothetical protein
MTGLPDNVPEAYPQTVTSQSGTYGAMPRYTIWEKLLDVSQYLYAVLVGVVLFAVGVIWIVARVRGRAGSLRIEPGIAQDQSPVTRVEVPVKKNPPVGPEAAPALGLQDSAGTVVEMPAEAVGKNPERPLEQGYKGFKIQLREKQPGLWVASIADARNRKKAADASLTHEYYQMPAALAEAKVIIDRRLSARR